MIRKIKNEGGYSLVEVMASIIILSIAIIPMVSMFDAGINASNRSSDYDRARSLAKKQLESAQSLRYSTVKNSMPNAPCTFNAFGACEAANRTDAEFQNLTYTIRKQFVAPNNNAAPTAFTNVGTDRGFMQVTVNVRRGSVDKYTTTSLKAR